MVYTTKQNQKQQSQGGGRALDHRKDIEQPHVMYEPPPGSDSHKSTLKR